MGTSYASAADLTSRAAYRAASGTRYAYSSTMDSAPIADRKVHETLDPKRLNTKGEKIRECLDSAEHPNTVPVVVCFDETGSMGDGPRLLVDKLHALKGITLRAGLPDVQLLFGAYGDAQNDEAAPCQIGQFESGLEMEEWLNNLYLEHQGGGNNGETAGLFLYYMANFTRLDSLEKRGKKGYLFITGDEVSLPYVTKQEIKRYIDEDVQDDIPVAQVIADALKSFDIYMLLVNNSSAKHQGSQAFWTKHLGADNVIVMESLEHVSEMISMIVARGEGVIDTIEDGATLLAAEGSSSTDIEMVSKTLAAYTSNVGTKPVVATSSGTLPKVAATADDSVDRL